MIKLIRLLIWTILYILLVPLASGTAAGVLCRKQTGTALRLAGAWLRGLVIELVLFMAAYGISLLGGRSAVLLTVLMAVGGLLLLAGSVIFLARRGGLKGAWEELREAEHRLPLAVRCLLWLLLLAVLLALTVFFRLHTLAPGSDSTVEIAGTTAYYRSIYELNPYTKEALTTAEALQAGLTPYPILYATAALLTDVSANTLIKYIFACLSVVGCTFAWILLARAMFPDRTGAAADPAYHPLRARIALYVAVVLLMAFGYAKGWHLGTDYLLAPWTGLSVWTMGVAPYTIRWAILCCRGGKCYDASSCGTEGSSGVVISGLALALAGAVFSPYGLLFGLMVLVVVLIVRGCGNRRNRTTQGDELSDISDTSDRRSTCSEQS